MKISILGAFEDQQTADYIMKTFTDMGHHVMGTDIRKIINDCGIEKGQEIILREVSNLKYEPELILVLKGLEMKLDTIRKIKKKFPKAKLVNWFFDKYLADKPIWENTSYFETLREFDYYFCSLKGVSDKLNELGFKNARFLDEACSEFFNGEIYYNSFQAKKYSNDISFIGSIGLTMHHPKRIPYLTRVVKEGFNLGIYGPLVCPPKICADIYDNIRMQESIINSQHSIVCNNSLINLGIDQDESLESGYSARVFRVLCCGGLYLTNYTKNLEKYFKINLKDQPITEDQEIVVYYSEDDLIKNLDYLLERDELRKKISINGKKKVLEKDTWEVRLNEMLKILEEKI